MSLEEAKELTSLFIRFEAGAVKGAHSTYLEGIKKDGQWMPGACQEGSAVPVSLTEHADQCCIADLLGDVNVGLIAQADTLTAELAERDKALTLKDAELAASQQSTQGALAQADALSYQLGEAEANVSGLVAEASTNKARIVELEQALAAAQVWVPKPTE